MKIEDDCSILSSHDIDDSSSSSDYIDESSTPSISPHCLMAKGKNKTTKKVESENEDDVIELDKLSKKD